MKDYNVERNEVKYVICKRWRIWKGGMGGLERKFDGRSKGTGKVRIKGLG